MTEPTPTTSTKTETVQQAPQMYLPDPGSTTTTAGFLLSGAVALVGGFLAFRKKWATTNLDVTQSKSAEDIIKTLQDQLQKAITDRDHYQEVAAKAWDTRADDAKKIGELTAKVEHLSDVNTKLEKTVEELLAKINAMQEKVESLTIATKAQTTGG